MSAELLLLFLLLLLAVQLLLLLFHLVLFFSLVCCVAHAFLHGIGLSFRSREASQRAHRFQIERRLSRLNTIRAKIMPLQLIRRLSFRHRRHQDNAEKVGVTMPRTWFSAHDVIFE